MHTRLITALVVCASLVVGLLLAEGLARLVLHPANYLSVEMQEDAILGAKPFRKTAAGAFDDWGFRNPRVPTSATTVALGDSHTYGNAAPMEQSWPHVLSELRGESIYNMGLGGYGPNQYSHLLTQALTLRPQRIIVGLYMGDDFENAFLITYGLDHWARLRSLPRTAVDYDIWLTKTTVSTQKAVRIWLSRHSVVYQLVVHGPLTGRVQGEMQIRHAAQISPDATTLDVPAEGVLEAFRPKIVARNVDQSSVNVREGMRITFELLREMKERCRTQGVDFLVVVIPTKESVFADVLNRHPQIPLSPTIAKLVENEATARTATFAALRAAGIEFVDVLPAMIKARGERLYARTAGDMHPNGTGYRVIATDVAAWMRARETTSTQVAR